MLIETLKSAYGRQVLWEKYNTTTGETETLTGTLAGTEVAPHIGKIEFVLIEMPGGRVWITVPAQVKEILP
jgi:hypothetical protein